MIIRCTRFPGAVTWAPKVLPTAMPIDTNAIDTARRLVHTSISRSICVLQADSSRNKSSLRASPLPRRHDRRDYCRSNITDAAGRRTRNRRRRWCEKILIASFTHRPRPLATPGNSPSTCVPRVRLRSEDNASSGANVHERRLHGRCDSYIRVLMLYTPFGWRAAILYAHLCGRVAGIIQYYIIRERDTIRCVFEKK